jgi:hypothetical protein
VYLCDFWGSGAFQLLTPAPSNGSGQMQPAEKVERGPTSDAAVPEKRPSQLHGLIIGLGGLVTVAWFCVLALLALWLIRAVL